ncbi:MAG: hypothetical protein V4520_13135 [Bacteroidota bacterium]
MQQQFDIDLPAAFAASKNDEAVMRFMERLFAPQGTAFATLVSALQYENKPKFGPATISNLRFEIVRYDLVSLKGRVRVLYDMQLTFGCEDMTKDHLNQHSYYNFNFILQPAQMHFASDAPEPASTADEF